MATNDDYKERLQIFKKKQLEEQEKTEQEIQQLRDEIEKIKREAEEIELTKESKYQNQIEKMKSEAWNINQIQVAIDKHNINKNIRELDVLMEIEETNERIGNAKLRIRQGKQKILEREKQLNQMKLQEINESIERKRQMSEEENVSSTAKRRCVFTSHNFYDIDVIDNSYSFDINELLNENNYFNDNILNYIEHYSNQFSSYSKLNEKEIREEFDHLIFNLLNTLNNNTSLKYFNTSSSYYLEDKFNPDCTFIYKNINTKINKEDSFLQDFVVCIGNLKSPNVSLSEDSIIEEILQYLKIILTVQRRQFIHGFLSNYTHIKFFRVYKNSDSNSYEYFQSQELEMFNYLSETLSPIDMSAITENKRKLGVNKDTWKMFIEFLTMDFAYYHYEGLKIRPIDDLLGDRYMITKKLINGYKSMVYLLEKNEDNHSAEDSPHSVMKILKTNRDSKYLLNEIKIAKILKRFNDSNKFHLFFQNIINRPSSSSKTFVY
ncbi:unnamed protein product [Rotaria sp. Silwood1]|nr:unnamed protein product [Rotaria sp. Silwood1]